MWGGTSGMFWRFSHNSTMDNYSNGFLYMEAIGSGAV